VSSVNKVILIGNLGADPEVRYLPEGSPVCSLRMATTEKWKDKNSGEPREATEWHRVVLYRKLAETAGSYLKKGASVYIEGRLRTRGWKDRDGQERQTTEIEASAMEMLSSSRTAVQPDKPETAKQAAPVPDFDDRDIPF